MRIIIALLIGLLSISTAGAQLKKPSDIIHDLRDGGGQQNLTILRPDLKPEDIWNKITTASAADLQYAAAMATAANTNGSKIRLQCINALIDANKQASGANLPKNPDGSNMAMPDPSLITHIEIMAEIVDNLSPQGPLFTSCAGAAQLFKMNVLQLINGIITGAIGAATIAPVIP
jgi:hypothetical protein